MIDFENAHHVLTITAAGRLDGLTVEHGYASNPDYAEDGEGGGVHILSASPTIENCRFWQNQAVLTGGAMYIAGESSPRIVRSVFVENRSVIQVVANGGTQGNGAAIGMDDYPTNTYSTPYIASCDFVDNVAENSGGAISVVQSSPTIVNSIFRDNVSMSGGSAIDLFFGSSPTVTNCTFVGNLAQSSGAALYAFEGVVATVANSIFWGNQHEIVAYYRLGITASYVRATYCIVQGGYSGDGNSELDPALDADLRPGSASPASNRGDSSKLPLDTADLDSDEEQGEAIPLDKNDQARVQGSMVDIGAHEFPE